MAKTFQYTYLTLTDAGEVLVVSFRQASILDQVVIDQIGKEFEQAGLEAASNRKLLLDFQTVEFMSAPCSARSCSSTSGARPTK